MARSFQVTGECMVMVKGPAGSAIASLTQLGLSPDQINVQLDAYHDPIKVNAWGNGKIPADEQVFVASATISMSLVNFDIDVLEECFRLGMAAPTFGAAGRTGALMGNGLARFAAGNNYIGLNITAPVNGKPYRFFYARLENRVVLPYGTEKQIAQCTWYAYPYAGDPWGGSDAQPFTEAGTGTLNASIWSHVLDE